MLTNRIISERCPVKRITNAIERTIRELRKRIWPMCSFANKPSCDRIVYAVVKKHNLSIEGRLLWKPE